ncbi:M18 family aminopeptidase [Arcanobacterium haemolyticum]|nr:M18 family aminopeptidase [Arcanobacterium haemolyticum]
MQSTIASADQASFAEDLAQFIVSSPSSYHAAHTISARLEEHGFVQVDEDEAWDVAPGGHFIRRGGAVIAWKIPEGAGTHSAFAVVGSHTDSPGFKLKPQPNATAHGFAQVNVETYGGLLFNSWINRELGLAGRIVTIDGTEHLVRTDPVMVIPQLAPHLNRGVNAEGLKLDPQRHLHPIWSLGEADVFELLAASVGVDADTIAGTDVFAYDSQAPQIMSGTFFASGRQDNLVSVHAALTALLDSDSEEIAVFAAFDHEEIGSATTSGASGPILESVLRRTATALGATEEEYWQMIARSSCVSADAGHSINPNYPEYHDPDSYPVMGEGPMLKINANQRYATDAHGQALWLRAAHEAGLATQVFVSNNAVSCGSTIGPLTATRIGIDTVDVGVPLLSMHSARELSAISDDWGLSQIIRGYWNIA